MWAYKIPTPLLVLKLVSHNLITFFSRRCNLSNQLLLIKPVLILGIVIAVSVEQEVPEKSGDSTGCIIYPCIVIVSLLLLEQNPDSIH